MADLDYVEELLSRVERQGIPAPSPIEQRWTASSKSALSPASAPGAPQTLFSWVGVIMYLPTEDEGQREAITNRSDCKIHVLGVIQVVVQHCLSVAAFCKQTYVTLE